MTQTVDSAGDIGYWNSLALDSGGTPHIAYYNGTNRHLKYALWNGASWIKQVVDTGYGTGRSCSIVLDGVGSPHICYIDWYKADLKYVTLGPQCRETYSPLIWQPTIANKHQSRAKFGEV